MRDLWTSSLKGDLDRVSALVNLGENVNTPNRHGFTALHYACMQGHEELCSYLIRKGAQVDAKCLLNGDTPLHCASRPGFLNIVELLVEAGQDLKLDAIENFDKESPLDVARKHNRKEIIALLEEEADSRSLVKMALSQDENKPRISSSRRISTMTLPEQRTLEQKTEHALVTSEANLRSSELWKHKAQEAAKRNEEYKSSIKSLELKNQNLTEEITNLNAQYSEAKKKINEQQLELREVYFLKRAKEDLEMEVKRDRTRKDQDKQRFIREKNNMFDTIKSLQKDLSFHKQSASKDRARIRTLERENSRQTQSITSLTAKLRLYEAKGVRSDGETQPNVDNPIY